MKRPTEEEIQRAHDILCGILQGDVNLPMCPRLKENLHTAHDTLAWVLGGACGETFQANLQRLIEELEARGYYLQEGSHP